MVKSNFMLEIKKHYLRKNTLLKLCSLLLLFLSSCSPLIAPYNEHIYRELASLKVETTTLVGKSNEEYSKHVSEVEDVDKDMNKLYEYMKGLPKNAESASMLKKIIDGDGMWSGIKSHWKTKGQVKPDAAVEFQKAIGEGFDELIELESKKIK